MKSFASKREDEKIVETNYEFFALRSIPFIRASLPPFDTEGAVPLLLQLLRWVCTSIPESVSWDAHISRFPPNANARQKCEPFGNSASPSKKGGYKSNPSTGAFLHSTISKSSTLVLVKPLNHATKAIRKRSQEGRQVPKDWSSRW